MPRGVRIKDDVSCELLPCPECGREVHTEPTEQVENQALRTCDKCGADFFMNLDRAPVYPTLASRRKRSPKQSAYLFFLRNAGTSYNPATETRRQGRSRGARDMARAERDARKLGYWFEWRPDWQVGSHVCEFGTESYPTEPATCEQCLMLDAEGQVVQSLGCVDDASCEYRRVVEADLALEELGR